MEFINSVIYGNHIDVMNQMPESVIDLTITSPPYDNIRNYENKVGEFDFDKFAPLIYKVTKPGGVLVWVVADQIIKGGRSGTSFRQALAFMDQGFRLHDTMIYAKSGCPYPTRNRYAPLSELMFVFSKGKPNTVNLIKDKPNVTAGLKLDRDRGFRQKDGTTKGSNKNKDGTPKIIKKFGVRGNIWRYKVGKMVSSKDRIAFKHPAIFPEGLAHDHILSWSNPGDLVFDPMCGSGTVLKMAKLLNRRFCGIDVVCDYCDISIERTRKAVDLFTIYS